MNPQVTNVGKVQQRPKIQIEDDRVWGDQSYMAWDGDRHGVKSRLHDEGDDESGPSQGILAVKKSSHWTEETPKSTVLVRLDVRGSKMEEDKRREEEEE